MLSKNRRVRQKRKKKADDEDDGAVVVGWLHQTTSHDVSVNSSTYHRQLTDQISTYLQTAQTNNRWETK
jgi:hypothetical protein